MAIVLLVVVACLDPGTRRRVLVLSVPVAAAGALAAWGFGGFLATSLRFVHPVLLSVPQWAVLGAAPVLGFAVAMVWLRRHEPMLRLVAAGSSGSLLSAQA